MAAMERRRVVVGVAGGIVEVVGEWWVLGYWVEERCWMQGTDGG